MASERPGVVPGPGGIALTAEEWFIVGLLGAAVVALAAVLLLPVGPFRHSLDPIPYKNWVGILIALVGGCFAGLGLGQWWDWRSGGSGWKSRPPQVRPGSTGIQGAPSFEVYTPDTARRPKDR
jgi:hypothetical protein